MGKLTDDQDVLQIVSGYCLEFDQEPMQTAPPTPFKLSRPEERLVDQEIKKLLKKGAIEVVEHAENQFLSNIFTVPKKDGTRRPVIDVRQLNQFVKKVPFKMEDLTQIPSVLQKGDFLCKIDLQDAYLSIPVAKKARVYLRFLWKGKLYQFTCLPFGLASSPRIFTKCLKPLLVYLWALGVHLPVYLDDFLIMAHTREQCLEQAQLIIGLLEKLGYLITREKSVLEPTQRLEYLGFLIDTVEMKFFLPEMKILKIQNLAEKFLSEQISARQLASLLGLLQATLPAITIAPLYFRNLQRDLSKALYSSEGKHSYRTVVVLSLESRGELMWWKNWLLFHNRKNFLVPKKQETIFSDASKKGWGAHLGPLEIGERWCLEERIQHINVPELQVAFLAIKALLPKIDKPHVQFAIDNQTAVTYINKLGGTRSHQLSLLAIELWHFALKMNLTLSAVYVPRIKNCIADRKSRVFKDSLEWTLNPQVFQQILLKMYGLEVDLFASRINHQLTAFVSWRLEPGAMAYDAFNLNWGLMKGYLFPPFCLIHRCIKKIQQDQAECILITPVWKSSPWYPVILSLLVDRPLLLPKDKLLQLPGTDKVHPLCSQKNFRLAASPLSGKKYQNRGFLRKCQRYCRPHGDKKLPISMKVPGRHGVAGVIRDKLIHFQYL